VLTHGEEEQLGRNYLLLESTAAKVYYIPYTREMEESRSLGGLKTNSFVRLRRRSGTCRPLDQSADGTSECDERENRKDSALTIAGIAVTHRKARAEVDSDGGSFE
jgi:hypothetical protein